jgi:uncharacterized protein (TIGR03435 family)
MQRLSLRLAVVGLLFGIVAHLTTIAGAACTAFCALDATGRVLVGNNEDYSNPRTKIRFVPATPGRFGRMYVGFDDMWPQGGMNERGLWFDGFATPAVKVPPSDLPSFDGNIVDNAMAECATVEDVVRLFSHYNRAWLNRAVLMFADASGDAVSIEPAAMVRKSRRHFVQTNFYQSRGQGDAQDRRFTIATSMLERAGVDISVDLFRRILAETHQNGASPTLYSNVYDLQARTMHLYYFHDFERAVTFDLAEELKKGERVLDIPSLFPPNADAEAFAMKHRREAGWTPGIPVVVALATGLCLAIGLLVYGWIYAGRRFRIGVALTVGALVAFVVTTAVVLHRNPEPSSKWVEFSIGPASGDSSTINPTMIRSDGMSLKVMLAVAFDIPAVRVIGPNWLGQARYSINAVVGLDDKDAFRPLLQQELAQRLNLQTHREMRPFDVLVLSASGSPRLERSRHIDSGTWVRYYDAVLRDATMERLASALQGIVGRPVIDETGITGKYNLDFAWGEDRIATLTATLQDRFGLRLSVEKRDLEALIVDNARRDASLVLLEGADRLTRGAPPNVRRQIANFLTVR